MKRIATLTNDKGEVVGLVHGPDFIEQQIVVNGRTWRFNFDRTGGPEWLRADWEPRKCQNPNKAVWAAFEVWMKENKIK